MGRRTNMKKLISTYVVMRTHLNIIAITVQHKTANTLFGNTVLYFKLAKTYLRADTTWM
jgi:hypothetical protein